MLRQIGDQITGTVAHSGDGLFVLEALHLALVSFSKSVGLPPVEVAKDLYRLAAGKVKP